MTVPDLYRRHRIQRVTTGRNCPAAFAVCRAIPRVSDGVRTRDDRIHNPGENKRRRESDLPATPLACAEFVPRRAA